MGSVGRAVSSCDDFRNETRMVVCVAAFLVRSRATREDSSRPRTDPGAGPRKSGRTENEPSGYSTQDPKRSKPQSVAADPAEGRVEQLTALLHELDGKRASRTKVLSRELHDTLVATLSATKMECDWLPSPRPRSGGGGQATAGHA